MYLEVKTVQKRVAMVKLIVALEIFALFSSVALGESSKSENKAVMASCVAQQSNHAPHAALHVL